jgi:hypothetical protein
MGLILGLFLHGAPQWEYNSGDGDFPIQAKRAILARMTRRSDVRVLRRERRPPPRLSCGRDFRLYIPQASVTR